MENSETKTNKKLASEHRNLAKNSFYSYSIVYLSYISSLLNSFLIARLINPESWDFLILASSYITISSLIFLFLPPSLIFSLNYFIPHYKAQKKMNSVKNFIKNSLIIKIVIVVPIFIIFNLIFFFFADFFSINLDNNVHLLFLLSPLIITTGLESIFFSIYRSFNKFNVEFMFVLLRTILNFGALLICFIFVEHVTIELLALITLISTIIPFSVNCVLTYFFYRKIERSDERGISLSETLKKIYSYGIHLSVKTFITAINLELETQVIGISEASGTVTGYNIATHYNQIPARATTALNSPLTISFSGLYSTGDIDRITKIYKLIFQYSTFFLLLIAGVFYFLTNFFLFFVYGEIFLDFAIIVQLLLISTILNILSPMFYTLLRAMNKVKYITPLILLTTLIRYPLFFIPLVFFGLIPALIGKIISFILIFILIFYLNRRLFKIKLDLKKISLLYIVFFGTIALITIFEILFLNNLYIWILNSLNLSYFIHFKIISIVLFVIIFVGLSIILKIITKREIEYIRAMFNEERKAHRVVIKVLDFLMKFMR